MDDLESMYGVAANGFAAPQGETGPRSLTEGAAPADPRSLNESMYSVAANGGPADPRLAYPLGGPPGPSSDAAVTSVGNYVVLRFGRKSYSFPSPQYVARLEDKVVAMAADLQNALAGQKRLLENQKSLQRQMESMQRALDRKLDRAD